MLNTRILGLLRAAWQRALGWLRAHADYYVPLDPTSVPRMPPAPTPTEPLEFDLASSGSVDPDVLRTPVLQDPEQAANRTELDQSTIPTVRDSKRAKAIVLGNEGVVESKPPEPLPPPRRKKSPP